MAQIRVGIVSTLAGIADCQKLPYRKDNPTPPTLQVIGLDDTSVTAFHNGGYSRVFILQGLIGTTLDQAAQEGLDEWMEPTGAKSVWAALSSDKTLGGTVTTSVVQRHTGTQIFNLPNGTQAFGTTWFLQVEI